MMVYLMKEGWLLLIASIVFAISLLLLLLLLLSLPLSTRSLLDVSLILYHRQWIIDQSLDLSMYSITSMKYHYYMTTPYYLTLFPS